MKANYPCFDASVAVVTGAGGGIGLAIAKQFLEQGAMVAMIDTKPAPDLAADLLENATYFQIDLTDEAAVENAFSSIVARYGRLDYLANVAGVLWFDRDKGMVDIDLDVWDQVLSINLKSMVHTVRHAIPHMKKAGNGAMVHFSTVQAIRGDAIPQDAYQCSKAGVLALSKSIAMQYAADGIRSNTIMPGVTDTPLQSRFAEHPEMKEQLGKVIPLGRVADPDEIASAALFLLSDTASYITGIELPVDGGLLLKY